jgi:putative nucleotidyltransferase with HDIG domain
MGNSNKIGGSEIIPDLKVKEVSKELFFEGMILPTNIYLKVRTGVYLLIGRKDEKAVLSDYKSIKNKDAKLYVHKNDHHLLMRGLSNLTERIIEAQTVSFSVKSAYVSALVDSAVDSIKGEGVASIEQIQRASDILLKLSKKIPNFNEICAVLEKMPESYAKHSMTTCLFSLLIAEEMKINQEIVLKKIALGAMLHDVGLKALPEGLLSKKKIHMNHEELALYEQHPIKSAEMIREIKDLPSEVFLIVAEHHENALGTGYPKKIRDIKISPLSKIVGLADYFAELLFNEEGHSFKPDEAISHIENVLGQPFNKQVFLALKTMINKKYLFDKAG